MASGACCSVRREGKRHIVYRKELTCESPSNTYPATNNAGWQNSVAFNFVEGPSMTICGTRRSASGHEYVPMTRKRDERGNIIAIDGAVATNAEGHLLQVIAEGTFGPFEKILDGWQISFCFGHPHLLQCAHCWVRNHQTGSNLFRGGEGRGTHGSKVPW